MSLKIFIEISIQPERFELLMNFSKKYKLLDKYKITIVENINDSDLIIFLVNSRINLNNISQSSPQNYKYIFETTKPIILLERQDSSITWARNLDKIKNLKAIFKNRTLRNNQQQNTSQTYYGKYQYYLINQAFKLNNLETSQNSTDIGISDYPKNKKLPTITSINLQKIHTVLWDFHSSPLCQKLSMIYFRKKEIDFNKTIDVFCVNQVKTNNFVNIPRLKAKQIVEQLITQTNPYTKNKYKVITNNLKPKDYEEIFPKSKIAVACWGFGEWVHMDAYAMFSGVLLIKPDTDYVKMYPDIYKSNETYIKCKHDYSDLEEIIKKTLKNYDSYIPMLKRNRQLLLSVNVKNSAELFWEKIHEFMNT